MKRLSVFALCILLSGCAAQVIHPGTANSFDSATYDTLLVADSVIQSTKMDLATNKFPATIAGNVKSALNILIAAYDALDVAYCGTPVSSTTNPGTLQCSSSSYHGAVTLGQATAPQITAVTNATTGVTNATAALAAAKGGT